MKKIAIFIISVLFLCGGLFGLHLTAQPVRNASSTEEKDSLLHRKLDECSEQELLELKVASHRKRVESITAFSDAGSPQGSAVRLTESQADLAAAEIELYRHTGEQDKLRTAWKARIEALTARVKAVTVAYQFGVTTLIEVSEAEIQLLDALLEQKRER